MELLQLLIIWLTPILLFFLVVYINKDKGESVKEYFKKFAYYLSCTTREIILLSLLPVINIPFISIFILFMISLEK